MKTKHLRRELMRVFGYETWPELKAQLVEATSAFLITVDWRCMAVGRKRDGERCAFGERLSRMPDIDKGFVIENKSYIRFFGSPKIFIYMNSAEMKHQIQHFDRTGMFDDMEEGNDYILEPPGKARSYEYARQRREAIKEGTHTVKPRGPNLSKRSPPAHYFRPY